MKRWIGGALILLMIGVLVLRGREADDRFERQIYSMGTLVTLTLRAPDRSPEALAALVSEVESELNRYQQRWSVRGSGALAQLNATLEESTTVPVPATRPHGIRRTAERAQGSVHSATGRWR